MARPERRTPRKVQAEIVSRGADDPVAVPTIPTAALVASASRYTGVKVPRIFNPSGQAWQKECYHHYRICGEARFAAQFFGHALSRVKLKMEDVGPEGRKTLTEGVGVDALNDLFNGEVGQSQMLHSIGVHLTIAGECYLVGREERIEDDAGNLVPTGDDIWEVVSVLEMKVNGVSWQIEYGEGFKRIDLTEKDVVIRIWQPAPDRRIDADSPFRSLLPILREIEWLTRHVFAQITSRLTGAGILVLPQEISFPEAPANSKLPETATTTDRLMASLAGGMLKPIEDPSAPEAVVPFIIQAPGEYIDQIKLLTFWTELDENSKELRQEAIGRFAVGMDLPAEQVLGMSGGGTGGGNSNGVSHWGAWQVEESTIKMHVEPKVDLLVHALVMYYLLPAYNGDMGTHQLVGSTQALRLRPDRSKEAIELEQAGLLKVTKALEENGFGAEDMPDEKELKEWFLRRIAGGSATPEQVEAALHHLGIDLNSAEFEAGGDDTRETRPAPSLEDHPGRDLPVREAAALIAAATAETGIEPVVLASEGLVLRALEKAGNKVLNSRTRGKDRDKSIDPMAVHTTTDLADRGEELLAGCWTTAGLALDGMVPSFAHEAYVERLRGFCLDLYARQEAYSRTALRDWMKG